MLCIFCKRDASNSKSVEHIVPRALQNENLILPAGIVCDHCNNYFSSKVEKPFLESGAINLLRFHQEIPSKKGRIPTVDGLLNYKFPAQFVKDPKSKYKNSVALPPESLEQLIKFEKGTLIVPASGELPTGSVLSRFMAKMALEFMVHRVVDNPEFINELTNDSQLDAIRNHARRGYIQNWPVSIRKIYDQNKIWIDEDETPYQVMHEEDILVTEDSVWFFIFALFGIEFVINYGAPTIEDYKRWLQQHNGKSPLYVNKKV